ncbi:MAG: Txe/YoeB family addiction module toxin [Chloroflexi bacterium]|nr:Txe/YoeB family addiction module toxin [Chloroflexota bacterium]
MRTIAFLPVALDDFNQWTKDDKVIYARIARPIKDIDRSPFSGLGKPEPLKHDLQGLWSRRITDEHRLVYKVSAEGIVIVSCKFHY